MAIRQGRAKGGRQQVSEAKSSEAKTGGAGRTNGIAKVAAARREAARARIKESTRQVLNRLGYARTRVIDITTDAGMAAGLFYRYYPDLQTLVLEMVDELIGRFATIGEDIDPAAPDALFERLRAHFAILIRNHADDPGIMRALISLGEASPDLTRRVKHAWERHLEFVLTGRVPPAAPQRTPERARLIMLGEAVAGVGEAPLTAYYTWRTGSTRPLQIEREQLAEWLSTLAYRLVEARNPPAACVRFAELHRAIDASRKAKG